MATIKILAQVGDNPVDVLAEQQLEDDKISTLRQTARLLRMLADTFDEMTTIAELDQVLRQAEQ